MIRISANWKTPFVIMPGVGPIYRPQHFETSFSPNVENWLLSQGYAEEVAETTPELPAAVFAPTQVIAASEVAPPAPEVVTSASTPTPTTPIVPDNDQIITATTVKEPEAVIATTQLAAQGTESEGSDLHTNDLQRDNLTEREQPVPGHPEAPPEKPPEVTQARSGRRRKAEPI